MSVIQHCEFHMCIVQELIAMLFCQTQQVAELMILPLLNTAYYYSSFEVNRVSVLPLHAAWICSGSIDVVWLLIVPILLPASCAHLVNIVA